MAKQTVTYVFLFFLTCLKLHAQDISGDNRFRFSGQVSAWGAFTPDADSRFWLGGRYIPQVNYGIHLPKERLIDFEASANAYGDLGFDRNASEEDVKFYRLWVRYSTARSQLRFGLQKINFGSAQFFRPLMWFDKIDPRDPLQMTDGVWGGLYRYYFRNNANIWVWVLAENDKTKGWETSPTVGKLRPEAGGRIEIPLPFGETALSYHYRETEFMFVGKLPENKFGFDIRVDVEVGLWLESSWIHYGKNLGSETNHQMLTFGGDYTFSIGNGLGIMAEHLVYTRGRNYVTFRNDEHFSGLRLSYPLPGFYNISGLAAYDWDKDRFYNFINVEKQLGNFTFYAMGFWNPANYNIPGQTNSNHFVGKGIQLMAVWNY